MPLSRSSIWSLAAALLLAWTATPARAADGAPFTSDMVAALEPGQFLWNDAGGTGDIRILVSIPLQRIHVYRGETLIGLSPISSGAPGFDTPVGDFTILEKDAKHRSNLYSGAPMPFMMRLTWDGIAIHAGRNPGYPDSHGCVRVPIAFARKLYGVIGLGTRVVVTDDYADPLSVEPVIDAPVAAPETVSPEMTRGAATSTIAWTTRAP